MDNKLKQKADYPTPTERRLAEHQEVKPVNEQYESDEDMNQRSARKILQSYSVQPKRV
jgi:hypothetical protein